MIYTNAFKRGLKPDRDLTVSEWAAENRILDSESSAEAGKWRNERTPYLVKPMDCLSSNSPVKKVVLKFASQLGKTELGNNWTGYIMDVSPAPTMYLMPTVDIAKDTSKTRISPMIMASPALRAKVKPSKTKDSGNTILNKTFEGGRILFRGANSAAGLASVPIQNLYADEVDRYPADVDGEGQPLSLAQKRTTTFARSKELITSTPVDKETSIIDYEFEHSSKNRYHIPCPLCGGLQELKFEHIKFSKDQDYNLLDDPVYECQHCKEYFQEHHKNKFLLDEKHGGKAVWIPEVPELAGIVEGFDANGLYSPLGWLSWRTIVEEFLEAKKKKDPALLKAWVNTRLAEAWEDEARESVDWETLYHRRESYHNPLVVPKKACIVVAGIDVQDDRLEVGTKAFGVGEESWQLEYKVFWGDPAKPDVWNQLTQFLRKKYTHETGVKLNIAASCIDTGGHHTKTVYSYVKSKPVQNLFAIKGKGGERPPVSRPSASNSGGVMLFTIGVDALKESLYYRMQFDEEGAGYMHFPMSYDEEYFKQLTSEKLVYKYKNGIQVKEWKKKRPRNEALDVDVYANAALIIRNPNLQTMLDILLNTKEEKPKKKPRKGGGFVTNW
jgi:phage terminase large subunit GpA-like protein